MSSLGKALGVLAALALVTGCLVGVYFLVRFVAEQLGELGGPVATLTGVAVLTVLLSARIIAGPNRRGRTQDNASVGLSRKAEVYRRLVEAWSAALTGKGPADALTTCSPKAGVAGAEKELVLW